MSRFRTLIAQGIDGLKFQDGELAYLALTSKSELHVRDRLAWVLTQHGGVEVAREWRRLDLALFDGTGTPAAVLQAKALYGADALNQRNLQRYRSRVGQDVREAHMRTSGSEVYALVVVTHVLERVQPDKDHLIKYGSLLRDPVDSEKASEEIRAWLASFQASPTRHHLGRGTAFDLTVDVDAWLCGPINEFVQAS